MQDQQKKVMTFQQSGKSGNNSNNKNCNKNYVVYLARLFLNRAKKRDREEERHRVCHIEKLTNIFHH